jgi:hypothetical protein
LAKRPPSQARIDEYIGPKLARRRRDLKIRLDRRRNQIPQIPEEHSSPRLKFH